MAPVFFGKMPAPARLLLAPFVRRSVRQTVQSQGTGRHTAAEIYALGRADLQALSDALGDKDYFLGDQPTSYDAAICCYHDQALIPIMTLYFDEGVNITLGLPIVRTSPDHGTAFGIAGKNQAEPGAMIAAIRMAAEATVSRSTSCG